MRTYVDDLLESIIEKAKKGGSKYKKVRGAIKWVGKEGFDACVEGVSKKHGMARAKLICGALKREARKSGQLAKKHMGRIEKKKAKGKE
jgi:hypothetical protein